MLSSVCIAHLPPLAWRAQVSRSLGDRRLKRGGEHATKGVSLVIPTPDVTSFALGREQRFLLLGCDGLWAAFSGIQAVVWLHERLAKMDERRALLRTKLDDPNAIAALAAATRAELKAERETATEEGVLKAMVHEAVHMRHAKDNVTALLLRLDH